MMRERNRTRKESFTKISGHASSGGRGEKKAPRAVRRSNAPFSDADLEQLVREGLSTKQIMDQIDYFRRGVPYIDLNRPCRVDDGIDVIPEGEHGRLLDFHAEAAAGGRLLKFVPASGAASRMFMDWYRYLEAGRLGSAAEEAELVGDLERYAFLPDLKDRLARDGLDFEQLRSEKKYIDILSYILTAKGLNYGQLPKALLRFHADPAGNRTAVEEHLVEAALYVRDNRNVCRLHITVSENHRTLMQDYLAHVIKDYESRYDAIYQIEVSIQESSTNTIAVDLENRPFRLEDGRLCFRPGGHGSLLENLNAIDGDIIFLKNIDNVVPDRLKGETVLYKKILSGYLVSLQKQIFSYLQLLDEKRMNHQEMDQLLAFCRERLHMAFPKSFESLSMEERQRQAIQRLNRPLRVCGMVKNEGEPGGGPFWINDADKGESLQIIEAIQIDPASESQKTLWQSATHFNPVDLVCGVRDFRGEKFDLRRFVNPQTASISLKSEKGRDLKALEYPGLWNGAMADWTTVFVEVPIGTFNPVKTVSDLLRPTHQPA